MHRNSFLKSRESADHSLCYIDILLNVRRRGRGPGEAQGHRTSLLRLPHVTLPPQIPPRSTWAPLPPREGSSLRSAGALCVKESGESNEGDPSPPGPSCPYTRTQYISVSEPLHACALATIYRVNWRLPLRSEVLCRGSGEPLSAL